VSPNKPSMTSISDLDPRGEPAEHDAKRVSHAVDDVPARRLLAHDLEHVDWDDDGAKPVPPPD
jgi:hypothetical protein